MNQNNSSSKKQQATQENPPVQEKPTNKRKELLQTLVANTFEKWDTPILCPMCKKQEWAADVVVFELRQFLKGNIKLGGPILPIVPLTCNYCGYTIFVNAIKAGLAKLEEEKKKPGEEVES